MCWEVTAASAAETVWSGYFYDVNASSLSEIYVLEIRNMSLLLFRFYNKRNLEFQNF